MRRSIQLKKLRVIVKNILNCKKEIFLVNMFKEVKLWQKDLIQQGYVYQKNIIW
jgi:hypothetical protein